MNRYFIGKFSTMFDKKADIYYFVPIDSPIFHVYLI